MTKLEIIADQIAERLTAAGYIPNRDEILLALKERTVEMGERLGITPRTAEKYFDADGATAQEWTKNILEGAQKLGIKA